ncbi:hypothetical protein NIIDNTM18_23280 [Mycolicibacterium litorale]|uniref:Orn/DAP/Arg decarboxylase 2 N-terminal domain-containing protein n=1 Tax=Mycolicibacterium litorale TaxID=758802 RepID=A0A6S6P8M1_9MYCO|nr:hypothetical protein [Mycolicibacterium litorale]BCI53050.1 hypothetical protein NIIDNTM18_23280 [Mycolicibacterium litorale]
MTRALDALDCAAHLQTSVHLMRDFIPGAGCGVPAAALADRALAAWVRDHGVTVTAHDDDELDLVRYHGLRPVQVVMRCGAATGAIGRAAGFGVSRFIVGTPQQMARLAESTPHTKYLYLDEHSPLVLGDRRLRVVGLHADVDDSGGAVEWAGAAERLLCRAVVLKTCGSPIRRISLSGGSSDIWMAGRTPHLASVVAAVDGALRDGCQRWRLDRPSVTLSPLTTARRNAASPRSAASVAAGTTPA